MTSTHQIVLARKTTLTNISFETYAIGDKEGDTQRIDDMITVTTAARQPSFIAAGDPVISEHGQKPPTAHLRMTLSGELGELRAAQTLINEAAKAADCKLHTFINSTGQGNYYLDILHEGDLHNAPVSLLSLVHKATQCDLKASVQLKIEQVQTPESDLHDNLYRENENKLQRYHYLPGIVVDFSAHERSPLMRETVGDYIHRELFKLTEAFGTQKPNLIDGPHDPGNPEGPHDAQVSMVITQKRAATPEEAIAASEALAEHVAGCLSCRDMSVKPLSRQR